MSRLRIISAVLAWGLVLYCTSPPVSAQGMLGQLKDEVKHGEKKKKKSKRYEPKQAEADDHHDDHDDDHHDDHNDALWHIAAPAFGELLWMTVTSPVWYPQGMLGDDGVATSQFLAYPYQADSPGFLVHEAERPQVETLYPWLLRIRGEYGEDFNSIRRASMGILYETKWRFGVDTSLDYYREWLPSGGRDDLWLGDFNAVYRFAQSDKLAMRIGLGANYLTGIGSTDLGFNFTYGGEWLPRRPWILSANIDVGTLGRVGFFRGRATVGINIRKVEFYTGYDYLDVGSVQIDNVIGGIQLWY